MGLCCSCCFHDNSIEDHFIADREELYEENSKSHLINSNQNLNYQSILENTSRSFIPSKFHFENNSYIQKDELDTMRDRLGGALVKCSVSELSPLQSNSLVSSKNTSSLKTKNNYTPIDKAANTIIETIKFEYKK